MWCKSTNHHSFKIFKTGGLVVLKAPYDVLNLYYSWRFPYVFSDGTLGDMFGNVNFS